MDPLGLADRLFGPAPDSNRGFWEVGGNDSNWIPSLDDPPAEP